MSEYEYTKASSSGGDSVAIPASEFKVHKKYVELVVKPAEEDEGGFIACVPKLPGVHSQGDSEVEALANVEEALHGALAAYKDTGDSVPWLDAPPPERDPDHRSKWVEVNE